MKKRELQAKIERLEKNLERTEAERAYWADLAQQRQVQLDHLPLSRYPATRHPLTVRRWKLEQ